MDAEIPTDSSGSPMVVRYAPQPEPLQRAALVITNSGLNTAMETLAQGVPLVVIPALAKLSAERIRSAVQRVLDDEGNRKRAVAMKKAIEMGVRGAADIAETALQTQSPVFANEEQVTPDSQTRCRQREELAGATQ